MIILKVMQYLTFTQRVSRYTVYRRPLKRHGGVATFTKDYGH
jgi:hypothetical protein